VRIHRIGLPVQIAVVVVVVHSKGVAKRARDAELAARGGMVRRLVYFAMETGTAIHIFLSGCYRAFSRCFTGASASHNEENYSEEAKLIRSCF
jgi:hypothetical protein